MFDEKTPAGLEPPRVGDEIHVPTRMHLSRGEEDFLGGLARVADVVIEDLGGTSCYFVEVEEDPGGRYNWSLELGPAQQELQARYGARRARRVPDRRPEFNVPIEEQSRRQRPLVFGETGNRELPYEAWFRGQHLMIRLNDFPAEELYTLIIDGRETESFSEWPAAWRRPRGPVGPPKLAEGASVAREHGVSAPRSQPATFRLSGDPEFPFEATVQGQRWVLRINDLPRRLFTLLIAGQEIEDFDYDQAPGCWKIPWRSAPS